MFNKKGFFVLIAIISIICITGCSNTNDSKETGNNNLNSSNITENSNSEQNNKKDKEEEKKKEPEYTKESLDEEISKQPVIVYSTEYLVQDADYKCLYPDLLIANIKNNSGTDVKKAEVLKDLYDCHACVEDIAQVYVKGIMNPVRNKEFGNKDILSQEEAELIFQRILDKSSRERP